MVWGMGGGGSGIEMDYSDLPALVNNPQTEQTYVKYGRFEDFFLGGFLHFLYYFFVHFFNSEVKQATTDLLKMRLIRVAFGEKTPLHSDSASSCKGV